MRRAGEQPLVLVLVLALVPAPAPGQERRDLQVASVFVQFARLLHTTSVAVGFSRPIQSCADAGLSVRVQPVPATHPPPSAFQPRPGVRADEPVENQRLSAQQLPMDRSSAAEVQFVVCAVLTVAPVPEPAPAPAVPPITLPVEPLSF